MLASTLTLLLALTIVPFDPPPDGVGVGSDDEFVFVDWSLVGPGINPPDETGGEPTVEGLIGWGFKIADCGVQVALGRITMEECLADDDGGPGIPTPTVSDLAIFAPDKPTLASEPVNVGLMGRPTNFVSTAQEHSKVGELFGLPVTVLFTPVSYTFDYGDGTVVTVADASLSWESAQLAQFTATPSSHTYATKGTFTVTSTVSYSAQVQFTGLNFWIPVDGVVQATTGGYQVQIFEAITALVDKDCIDDPAGVGCPG